MPGSFAIATYPVGTAATISVSASPEVVVPITVGLSSCFGYTTAGDIIRRALHHILVEASESTLQPDEYESGLDILNSYMAALESDGVQLGYQQVCNIADIVNVPNGAVRGIAANLAIDLAPQFGGRVTAALLRQAEMGLKTLYHLGVNVGESNYGDTLPIGAGNYWTDFSAFYTNGVYAAMSIAGNRRTTSLTVASQAEKVNGFWTVQDFHSLTPDISGRITNRGEGVREIEVYAEFNLKSSVSTAGGVIAITKNNAIELYAEDIALSTTPVSALLTGSISLEGGDFIDIVVADTVNASNTVTLIDSVVRLSGSDNALRGV